MSSWVAWEPLGWEPVCFAEFDEFPSAVLAERYPEVPNIGDVTKMNWKKYRNKVLPKIDRPWRPRVIAWAGPAAFYPNRSQFQKLNLKNF